MHVLVGTRSTYCYTGGKPFNPDFPAVVFIHGAQHDHSVWALQTRYFAHHGFSVLAPDLPGHGRSAGPLPDSIEAMAAWVVELLDVIGVQGATLVGHSMGSLIALETVYTATDRVDRIALMGTAFPMKVSNHLLAAASSDEAAAIEMVNAWSHSSIAQKPSCPGPGFYVPGVNRRLMRHISQRTAQPVFHTGFSACNAYANGMRAAESVRCPALFILGKQDRMTPPGSAAALIDAIPHAKIVVLERCGHAIMAEQPDAALDALFAFAGE